MFAARAGFAGAHGLPLTEFLSWDQHDQEVALAYQGYESRRCRSCGHHPDTGQVHAHIDVCQGCIALESKKKQAEQIPGSHVRLAQGRVDQCPRCSAEAKARRRSF